MDETSIKTELLAEIELEWAHVERICAGLGEAEMVARHASGEWSVKDTLCHISAWEKYLLDRLAYVLTGQKPIYPAMFNWDDVHHFNAQVFAENKDRPLNSAVIEFRSLYRGVMTVLESMDDEQLNMPYSYDFPEDRLTLQRLIRGNTCDHYREHCTDLEKRKKG
jgi:hypothetical protein